VSIRTTVFFAFHYYGVLLSADKFYVSVHNDGYEKGATEDASLRERMYVYATGYCLCYSEGDEESQM